MGFAGWARWSWEQREGRVRSRERQMNTPSFEPQNKWYLQLEGLAVNPALGWRWEWRRWQEGREDSWR